MSGSLSHVPAHFRKKAVTTNTQVIFPHKLLGKLQPSILLNLPKTHCEVGFCVNEKLVVVFIPQPTSVICIY